MTGQMTGAIPNEESDSREKGIHSRKQPPAAIPRRSLLRSSSFQIDFFSRKGIYARVGCDCPHVGWSKTLAEREVTDAMSGAKGNRRRGWTRRAGSPAEHRSGSPRIGQLYSVLNLAVAPPSTIIACPVMNDACSSSTRN
jgi:hypothetical protein